MIIGCDQTGCRRVRLSPHPPLGLGAEVQKIVHLAMDQQDHQLHAIRADLALGACILGTPSFSLRYQHITQLCHNTWQRLSKHIAKIEQHLAKNKQTHMVHAPHVLFTQNRDITEQK